MQVQVVQITANNLQWKYFRDEDQWVATCDQLRLSAVGETWNELVESIVDMMNHLFADLYKTGELPRFLSERGWSSNVTLAPGAQVRFDVPWGTSQIQANEAFA
jgi:hypothetical protein